MHGMKKFFKFLSLTGKHVLLSCPGLAEFPLVFVFTIHRAKENYRVVVELPSLCVADPYLMAEIYYSHRKKAPVSMTSTTSLTHSIIRFCLH
jgi:hypothetical protein